MLCAALFAGYCDWFVHHPREWIEEHAKTWPPALVETIVATGEPVGDWTDAIGLTGTDATCEYRGATPAGQVFFAGEPVRTGGSAPDDIETIERGEFTIGWSPQLRHPVWVGYHVTPEIKHEALAAKRPKFAKDKRIRTSPAPSEYMHTGYDRGHMAPNYAIASRFGGEMQKKTFLMSNISPQKPGLNSGVWRDLEHRIAKSWARKWGETWVVAGAIPGKNGETLPGTGIDVPSAFWQVVAAVKDGELRAFAVLIDQNAPKRAWPTRYIVSIRELENATGLDFFPLLDCATQDAIETQTPTRLWPAGFFESFANLWFRGI